MSNDSRYAEQHYAADERYDVELPEGERDETMAPDPATVLRVLAEVKKDYEDRARLHLDRAQEAELFILGEQWNDGWEEDITVSGIPSDERVSRNYMRPLSTSYSARVNEDRWRVRAFPRENSYTDREAAEVANAIIEHVSNRNELDDLMFWAIMNAQPHGMIGLKTTWDPTAGPEDYFGEPEGDVDIELVTIFEMGVDNGGRDPDHCQWCYCSYPLPEHDAWLLLREAGYEGHDGHPSEKEYSTIAGHGLSGVETTELWYRPSPRFPEGLYAVIVDGKVTTATSFPYEHGQIPISFVHIQPRRDSTFGTSHVYDALPMQRYLNRLVSNIARLIESWGESRPIFHAHLADSIKPGHHAIRVTNRDLIGRGKGWDYIMPPDPPALIVNEVMEVTKALYDLFGLNEMLTGRESPKSGTSGKAIAFLKDLDSQKMAGCVRSMHRALKRVFRQTLSLYQQFTPHERLIRVAGEEGRPDGNERLYAFTGADLKGFDIILEPAAGHTLMRTARADMAREQAQMGMIAPGAALESEETGLNIHAPLEADVQAMVGQQLQRVAAGEPPQPAPGVQPMVAAYELSRIANSGGADPVTLQAANALLAVYLQAANAPQAPAGAPPQ